MKHRVHSMVYDNGPGRAPQGARGLKPVRRVLWCVSWLVAPPRGRVD